MPAKAKKKKKGRQAGSSSSVVGGQIEYIGKYHPRGGVAACVLCCATPENVA